MPLCFIEPQEAIRVVAESVGREARRQLLGEVVRAWVDEIPDDELLVHYAKAVDELDDDDLSILAAWHASLEVGQPIANKEFLLGAFTRARRAPPRGAPDRRRLQGRGRLRGRRERGAGARHRAAVALARPAAGARRRGGRAVLLGPPGLRQLAARIAAPGGVLGRSRACARFAPCVLARLALRRLGPRRRSLSSPGCGASPSPAGRGARRARRRARHPAHRRRHPLAVGDRQGAPDRGRHAGGLRRGRVLRARGVGVRRSGCCRSGARVRYSARRRASATATAGRSPTSTPTTAAS